ncbi:uncharacterized protein LOC129797908 isoform X1 [Phlebotomus papatasi]|uniref:uncharacterized protein LOC129797908 isoform X1 n=1 Tax=Phlebotomus papatasi TaxID=29031 RepID=UPI002484062D|nr:uncharacterized protein LOC129797908 isoform X1 [Phlebotomus papatasi]
MSRSSKKIKPKGLIWTLLSCVIAFILSGIDMVNALKRGRLLVPVTYTALEGDLRVQLQNVQLDDLGHKNQDHRLHITRIEDSSRTTVGIIDIYPDPFSNVTQITVPCQYFLRGGLYEFEVVGSDVTTQKSSRSDNPPKERLRQQLDVRWPMAKLSVTPESIGTYPQEPVDVILEFPSVECNFPNTDSLDVPEFWLELNYCGHEIYCDSMNVTKSQILYAEQVRGFPRTRIVKLRCELFGLAGHYVLKLRPTPPTPNIVSASAFIKADWSDQFVFNVHARSIFPCDPMTGGIGVLFEYPACILDQADRVRLFAKLRADVASLAPPTSLHYVTEQRVVRGQHSLHFDCDLFSEKYVEYCFVYVSQAISGAVADIRMDCVPTLPVSEQDTGGWGPFSEWTPCSTTCAGGTRNRYRFCDSPPPRYGAKFCEGPAVETERCGGPESGTWECLYGSGNSLTGEVPADRPEVIAEIGPGCRCGCIVHLGAVKSRRLIASSSRSCPGRTFWLVQADEKCHILFKLDFFRLPCATQYLKIRDGDSLSSELIGEFIGGYTRVPDSATSSGSQMLLEFLSDELASMGESCGGGFLAHVQQICHQNASFPVTSRAIIPISTIESIAMKLTIAHVAAIAFVSVIIVMSLMLGTQYVFRYRKYQLAESKGEPDSPAHTPRTSLGSLVGHGPPSRAISTSTLLSDVISLVKFRPGSRRVKHSRLRENLDTDTLTKSCSGDGHGAEVDDAEADKSHSDDDASVMSSLTITNEKINEDSGKTPGESNSSNGVSPMSLVNTNTPPSDGSISSLPPTPLDTPIPGRRSLGTPSEALETKSVNGGKSTRFRREFRGGSNAPDTDTESIKRMMIGAQIARNKKLSVSNVTLTNGSYSPALSMTSTATIRTTSQKESKDKRNRQKLLAGPGSEFSLANPEELELDYYDYNVINAGAAPGSYLGMDPAYLVWIPPLDQGNIIRELTEKDDTPDRESPQYEEILPRHENIDPGSNTETPDEETPSLSNTKTTLMMRKIPGVPETSGIQLQDFTKVRTAKYPQMAGRLIPTRENREEEEEKETSVVKSPSNYFEMDDIKFADDDHDHDDDCNKRIDYHSDTKKHPVKT